MRAGTPMRSGLGPDAVHQHKVGHQQSQPQGGAFRREGAFLPGPVYMKEYSLRQQGVSRLSPHNGRAELIVRAAVQDGPGLGDIVQHGRGPGCLLAGSFRSDSHILRTARQTHGHIGHGAAVRPDIGKHGIFFPQCLALVPVRHGQREVGSQLKRRIRAG